MDERIFFSSIAELRRGLDRKEFSCVELTRGFLGRLRTLGPRFNAVANLTEERALREAAAADEQLRRGGKRRPLLGIPYGAKDLLSAEGAPTTWGSEFHRSQTFDRDATLIARLQSAGAILAAKLTMVRFAGGGGYLHPTESLQGPGRNPWSPERWAGGSSSGPGCAVAAGLTPFAIGSETWGSILTPATFCGITGLRPTYGRVSRHGAMALSWTMDKLGPMARSAEDCALVLEAIAGPDTSDPSCVDRPFRAMEAGRGVHGLRAGFSPLDFGEWPHPDTHAALKEGLRVLTAMGIGMREETLPDMPYGEVAGIVIRAEGSAALEEVIQRDDFDELPDPRQKEGLREGLKVAAAEYLRAMRIRTLVQQQVRELFKKVDFYVTITLPDVAQLIDDVDGAERKKRRRPRPAGHIDMGAAGNLAGAPAVSFPCGFSTGGLPVGLTLVGPPFQEGLLLAVVKEFQRRTDWHRRHPNV